MLSTIYMESPLGYALDVLACGRGIPGVRETDWGGHLYRTMFNSGDHVGWPNTIEDYENMGLTPQIKAAVKRLLVEFRGFQGDVYLSAGPTVPNSLEEYLERVTLSVIVPPEPFYKVEIPRHFTQSEDLQALAGKHAPHLIVHEVRTDGNFIKARMTLNPDHFTPTQMRFSADIGYNNQSWITIGNRDSNQRAEIFGVGPRGGVTRADSAQFGVTPNIPNKAFIEALIAGEREAYRNRVLNRMRGNRRGDDANAEFERKRIEHQAKTAVNFTNWRATHKPVTEMHIPTLPFLPHGVLSSRTWGIEIETGAGRDITSIPRDWESKGDGSLQSAYDGDRWINPEDCEYAEYHGLDEDDEDYSDPDYCDDCGSVYGGGYRNGDCVEVVSPILRSVHSRGLESLCNDLEFAPRTDTAGIHVHVEARDLTQGQIRELVMGYDHIEFLIEASYDRVERGYCKRRSTRELLEISRSAGARPDDAAVNVQTGDRYVTVNLNSLSYHGTVEFRAMGPKYNYDHLVRWAMFCREMVNSVKNGATSKLFAKAKTWSDVTDIFARYGNEYKAALNHEQAEVVAELQEV